MRTLGLIAAGWMTLSLIFATCWALARRGGWKGATVVPQPLHLVSDERFAEQAGERL